MCILFSRSNEGIKKNPSIGRQRKQRFVNQKIEKMKINTGRDRVTQLNKGIRRDRKGIAKTV